MSDITITKTAEDSASKAFRVTVPVDRVRAAEDRAISEYGRRVRLPGFRQGKAPMAVIRKRLGDSLKQWVVEEIVRESWEETRATEEISPINDPQVRNLKFEEGQPVEFEILVEVRPEIRLDRVGGFTIARQVPAVTDELVTEQIDKLRERKAAWLPLEDQAPAEGNLVNIEVAAVEDGEVKPAQPYDIIIGQGQTVAAIEEQILQLKPGQSAETDIKYPDDHPDASRRGQSRRVHIALRGVKRQELPPLDDSFAKSVGDFDDLPSLQAAVRKDMEEAAEREADAGIREQLLQQVIAANNIEAPPSLTSRALHGLLHAYQVPHEREEKFYNEFRPLAEAQVKRELVLGALAQREKLFATEAEMDQRIKTIADARGVSFAEVYGQLEKGKRLQELERAITEEKVFGFLLPQSTIEEKS